jgi:uncharacterized membrane protein
MTIGPVQLLVVGFEHPNFRGEILAELERLKEHDVVRVVDMLVANKDDEGNLTTAHLSDLSTEEAMEFGATVGALIGLGAAGTEGAEAGAELGAEAGADGAIFDDETMWDVGESIPNGSAAAIVLLEHRWAIPLREKILAAGGMPLADAWVHPQDLVAVGLMAAADAPMEAEPAT